MRQYSAAACLPGGGAGRDSRRAGKAGRHNAGVATPAPKRRHKTDPPPLSVREIRFCQIWCDTENATRAYTEAGFRPLPRRSTEVLASRLLRKVEVREYIRTLQRQAADAARVTVDELAAAMAGIVRADLRKLYDKRGAMLPPDQWPDDVAATVEQVESEEVFEPVPGEKGKRRLKGYARKVKKGSRVAAASKLMEWKGMTGAERADPGAKVPDPMVVGGKADPANL